jgi:hypothetical protein
MISDPAALHHIFVRLGYRYPKQPDRTILATLIGGKGILWAAGRVGFWPRDPISNMRWSYINFLKVNIKLC